MIRTIRFMTGLFLCCGAPLAAQDWPRLLGPDGDGRAQASAALSSERVALEVAWRAPIGNGYSGVVVAGQRVVTMFTSGDDDVIAAFDAANGKQLWRQRIAAAYPAHDGADGGPLSTPVIAGTTVFGLSATGELAALRLEDGKPLWSTQLVEKFGAKAPEYGFATSPLVVDGTLVVQVGGDEGRSICGFDAATGASTWCHGDGPVVYQSPAVMTLGNKRQVVFASGSTLCGIDPTNGTVLWAHSLGEGLRTGSSQPVLLAPDRVLLQGGNAALFVVSREAESWTIKRQWESEHLGNTYVPPVFHDGHLYGYRGEILTCVDVVTGERVWRSRPPGGHGLTLVGDRLVVFGKQGAVVVVDADAAGYQERTTLEALESSGFSWPVYAAERIFVRNLTELVAIRISETPAATAAR